MHIRRTSALSMMMRIVDHIEQASIKDDDLLLVVSPSVNKLNNQIHPAMSLFSLKSQLKVLVTAYAPDGLQDTYLVSHGKIGVEEMQACILVDDRGDVAEISDKIYRYLQGNLQALSSTDTNQSK